MVDNHVGDGSDAIGFKSLDEAAEFLFRFRKSCCSW